MHMEITPDIIQKALKKLQPDMSSGQFPKNVLRSMHFLPVQPGTVSTTEPVVES